ncbi:MAG TPA: gliding motility-associated C-terminal domain-containing protein, partial [Elusimicrobiota bacterium]|nr:gliding motility-associated C-terminal domain-containing protein [Elusimicrobiota bacterium]
KLKFFGLAMTLLLLQGDIFALKIYSRIFTPNGDGWNDQVVFEMENPGLLPLKGEIFDLTGAKVDDMIPGPNSETTLKWNGKKSNVPVPSGIYIYQIELGGKITTGTVVVAQ